MTEVKTNSHGTNSAIQFHILSDSEMRDIGFTDNINTRWFYSRYVFKSKDIYISFDVTIPKDGSEAWIEVIDDSYCQPYDYQYLLSKNPSNMYANSVKQEVEKQMTYLMEKGVISGHEYGEYI